LSGYRIGTPQGKCGRPFQPIKENNDWLAHFLEECCELDQNLYGKVGVRLYQRVTGLLYEDR